MKISRINLFVSAKFYLNILFGFFKNDKKKFLIYLSKIFKTNNFLLFSQGRVALYDCLKFEIESTKKNEIIVSPYTLPEVINVIINLKAKPIFVDLDLETGLPNIKEVKKKINKNTLAVLITHLYSSELNIKKFTAFTKKNLLCLIEDCAINFGSKIRYKHKTKILGTLGDYGFFSFGMMKNICLMNGGALYVKDKSKYDQINNNILKKKKFPFFRFINLFFFSLLINFFFSKFIYNIFTFKILKHGYEKESFLIKKIYPGLFPFLSSRVPNSFKFDFFKPLSTAAIYQLKNFKSMHLQRVKKIKLYNKPLKSAKNIKLLKFDTYNENSFLEYPIIIKNKKNHNVHSKLLKSGFDIRKKWYIDCSTLRKFKINMKSYPNIKLLDESILCLPVHDKINKNYIEHLAKNLLNLTS